MLSRGFSDRLLGVQDPNLQFREAPYWLILRGALDMLMSIGIKGELRVSDPIVQDSFWSGRWESKPQIAKLLGGNKMTGAGDGNRTNPNEPNTGVTTHFSV